MSVSIQNWVCKGGKAEGGRTLTSFNRIVSYGASIKKKKKAREKENDQMKNKYLL